MTKSSILVTKEVEDKLNTFQAVLTGSNNPLSPNLAKAVPEIVPEPRPSNLLPSSEKSYIDALLETNKARSNGLQHRLWERIQRQSWPEENWHSVNIVDQRVIIKDGNPFRTEVVIINNPEDAEIIGKSHVKKNPLFTPFLFESLIATTDNEHWKKQRNHFNEVFLPLSSLAPIFPISVNRAEKCVDILEDLRLHAGPYGVQMHDFYLHEAQAQLQLGLFGVDEKFMNDTNEGIRDAFAGRNPNMNFAKDMCLDMMSGKGQGPLAKSVAEAAETLDLNLQDQFGNMMLILFAGHDTTGHTMTWLTFELARHPQYQDMLHAEVDTFLQQLNGRKMEYSDLDKLPFMTRCIMETLRLWPAVADGTHRELEYDTEVTAPNGDFVTLAKGTYVQIPNWSRHRNPELWGDDADQFNPLRDFQEKELWEGTYAGFNPYTERFSPFAFAPRDCLGKNFAHMEMRAILTNVFSTYRFELSEPYKQSVAYREVNNGTMGPRDLRPEALAQEEERVKNNKRPLLGMWLHVTPRQLKCNL